MEPRRGLEDLAALAPRWDVLAQAGGSPFLTVEWLTALSTAFGLGTAQCLTLRDAHGELRAGACCRRRRGGGLAALANVHSGDWDVVAADEDSRAELWARMAAHPGLRHLELTALPEGPSGSGLARQALADGGFRVVEEAFAISPFLPLPSSWEEFLASRSRNLRSQLGRRRRALEKEGTLRFRAATAGGRDLERDLDDVFRIEAAGWKTRSGTAILSDPRTEALYRNFARAAAGRGWLRLYLLELDGAPIAVDYGIAFAGRGFLLKTGFDERHARLSPGLVLRAEVLRASIQEGLRSYDFLGGPDGYKLRWTDELRPRVTMRGYRGAVGLPGFVYRAKLRPRLVEARARVRSARARSDGGG